jgi:hypothetical protein
VIHFAFAGTSFLGINSPLKLAMELEENHVIGMPLRDKRKTSEN